jgi:hypothetical protein
VSLFAERERNRDERLRAAEVIRVREHQNGLHRFFRGVGAAIGSESAAREASRAQIAIRD